MEEHYTLDDEVWNALPPGSKPVAAVRFGDTSWSVGVKATVEYEGVLKHYFIKMYKDKVALSKARCDYECAKTLTSVLGPSHTIPGVCYGSLPPLDSTPRAFSIIEFRNLDVAPPPMTGLIPSIAKLRQVRSPTGKYGFHVPIYYGFPAVDTTWTDSWTEYFARDWRDSIDAAQKGEYDHGDTELWALALVVEKKVIGALLGPLETGGKKIEPTLCHGDVYPNNVQMDVDTGATILFDGCCFYGHWESDLQIINRYEHLMGRGLLEKCKQELGASEPVDMFDDRIALYALRNDFYTINAREWGHVRLLSMKDTLRGLIAKYA